MESLKFIVAYGLVIIGVFIFMLGENFLTHKYIIERLIASSVFIANGLNYAMILEARLEKYGRC